MKREIKTQLTKEKILAAAIIEFGTKGYEGSTMNEICDTGIPKGLVYHNYKNKDDLYLCCVEKCFTDFVHYVQSQEKEMSLTDYLTLRTEYWGKRPAHSHLFFEALLQPPALLKESISRIRIPYDILNQELYQSILSGLHLRQGVSMQDAVSYFGMFQDMFNQYYSNISLTRAITAHEEKLQQTLDFMLYGICEKED